MEHLVIQLKEKLITRRCNELERAQRLQPESQKDLILISSGKIFELEFLIQCLDELIAYHKNTKNIIV
jgi:hypothetical protein